MIDFSQQPWNAVSVLIIQAEFIFIVDEVKILDYKKVQEIVNR